MKIKQIIKSNLILLKIISFIYNLVYGDISFLFSRKTKIHCPNTFLKGCKLKSACGGEIIIGEMARLRNCKFYLKSKNCRIIIGAGSTIISNTTFYCENEGSQIIIGNDFTMQGGSIASIEGNKVVIGNNCMFSYGIDIRNGDSHSIIRKVDKTKINKGGDIIIGNNVWLTANVKVLKNVHIASDVVGNSSVVTSDLADSFCVYAGIPAKKVKEGIIWKR